MRDLRVRRALEEAGLPYEEHCQPGDNKSESYRRLQPFGQVPTYEEGGLVLFESERGVAYRRAVEGAPAVRSRGARAGDKLDVSLR